VIAVFSIWAEQARAYYQHHFACATCIAAGRGHGQRCEIGAGLWTAYQKEIGGAE